MAAQLIFSEVNKDQTAKEATGGIMNDAAD